MNGYVEITKNKLTTILDKLPKEPGDLKDTTKKYLQAINIVNSLNDPRSGSVSFTHTVLVPTEYILTLIDLDIFE